MIALRLPAAVPQLVGLGLPAAVLYLVGLELTAVMPYLMVMWLRAAPLNLIARPRPPVPPVLPNPIAVRRLPVTRPATAMRPPAVRQQRPMVMRAPSTPLRLLRLRRRGSGRSG
ncbi:hypothetical protein, partial [Nonomuraea zeae]|uniref:hypothetical protein n=1 Tax=Nonomuraea zeae TaxID=1642303 RepID=UPI00197F4203